MRILLCALLLPPLSGCFFTQPINERPRAEIEDLSPAPLYVEGPLRFDAGGSNDPDGDELTYLWHLRYCDRPDACDPVVETFTTRQFETRLGMKRPLNVHLTVEDSHGATAVASVTVTPANRAPEVTGLQARDRSGRAAPFTVGQLIALATTVTDEDQDPVTPSWTLFPPTGTLEGEYDFEVAPDGLTATLTPRATGLWQVRVTASDGADEASRDLFLEVDADRSPCIAATTPAASADYPYIVERSGGARRFSVDTVLDDLDPWPFVGSPDENGVTTFRWSVTAPETGALAPVPSRDLNDLALDPSSWMPGDSVRVRVEVTDRVGLWPACPADQDTCSHDGDTCLQRVTWRVQIR